MKSISNLSTLAVSTVKGKIILQFQSLRIKLKN